MRIIFLLLLSCFSIGANAQVQVLNRSLTDSTLPYLYIGVDNAIQIDWKELQPEEHFISITGGNGSLMKMEGNRFIVRVSAVTDSCFVRISNKKRKIIFERAYKVRVIKDHYISLDGLRDTTVSRSRILENPALTVACQPDCYYPFNIKVISFELSAVVNEKVVIASATGNLLSGKQINMIKSAESNGFITIDNIRASMPDGRLVKLPSIVIYYKG